jgi:hypothetical protein
LLEAFTPFVFQKGKFIKLPDAEKGHFFLQDAYVFLCVYRSTQAQFEALINNPLNSSQIPNLSFPETNSDNSYVDDRIHLNCVVYFCQSKKTSKVPYSTFKLATLKEMEELVFRMYECPIQVQLVEYGLEPFSLLAHLENSYTLHNSSRQDIHAPLKQNARETLPNLYQIRTDSRYRTTRTVQIDVQSPIISKDCFLYLDKILENHILLKGTDYELSNFEFAVDSVNSI